MAVLSMSDRELRRLEDAGADCQAIGADQNFPLGTVHGIHGEGVAVRRVVRALSGASASSAGCAAGFGISAILISHRIFASIAERPTISPGLGS
jgi:hypothetical protein